MPATSIQVPHRSSLARAARGATAGRAFAVLVGLHGLIHLIGFVVPWRLATLEGFAYSTTAAWGAIDLGETGARVLGIAWLFVAVAFVAAAVGLWRQRPWGGALTAVAAIVSLPLCVLGSPNAIAGVVVNVAILGALAFARAARR